MANQSAYAPPMGPPPPQVPPGWKAQYNDQYKEWFYVNLHTEQSQWELPTAPADAYTSTGAPPHYTGSENPALAGANLSDTKKPFDSNNPYGSAPGNVGPGPTASDDAAMAARLQAEEDARARGAGHSPRPDMQNQGVGGGADYYNQGHNSQGGAYPGGQQQQQYGTGAGVDSGKSGKSGGGLLGKIAGKLQDKMGGGSSHGGHGQHGGGAGGYGGYSQHQPGYGGSSGYGHQSSHGGGGLMGMLGRGGHGGGGGYGGHGGGHGYPPKKGMGAGGAAALGVGGGLAGGMLLANAMDDDDDYGGGGGGGGDFGGGDDGGGGE